MINVYNLIYYYAILQIYCVSCLSPKFFNLFLGEFDFLFYLVIRCLND